MKGDKKITLTEKELPTHWYPENPTTQERRRNREKRKRDARILPGIRENGRTSIPIRKSISTKRMYPLE